MRSRGKAQRRRDDSAGGLWRDLLQVIFLLLVYGGVLALLILAYVNIARLG